MDSMNEGISSLARSASPSRLLRGAALLSLGLMLAACRSPSPSPDWAQGEPLAAAVDQSAETKNYRTEDLDWQDGARSRAVPARLYWPAKATASELAGGTVPLIVFSHGIGGSRRGYSYLGAYWSSQGYASLHVQHIGSDRGLWAGNPFGLVGRLQEAAKEGEALNRVADVRFALDQLLQSPYGVKIDTQRISAAGHSYGANTVMLLSGAEVTRQGQTLAQLRDPRIKAAILISAPPFYGETEKTSAILKPISIPSLHITASEDVINIPGYHSDAKDRIAVFEAIGSLRKSLVVFEGGSHSIFTDRAAAGGVTLNPKVKAATQELSLAFLTQVYQGKDDELRQWGERHAGLVQQWRLSAELAGPQRHSAAVPPFSEGLLQAAQQTSVER
ncbi:alpha/beta hydrolase family protein [Roseateles sp.]|uniref:alpha/beta hydrolase family protein n=1 Tax=Roseateles sp. TaxID=1971397 RepID=UPI003BA47469